MDHRPVSRAVIAAVHGILTRNTIAQWPDHLRAAFLDCAVVTREYWAWPFPRLNVFVKNPIHARALAADLELVLPTLPLHIVAHSNGCDVAVKTVQLLAAKGIRTETLILTGSVTDPDVHESGIWKLIASGMLGKAFAYISPTDGPLSVPSVLKWPYKDLGRVGWVRRGDSYQDLRIRTRIFPGGHSGYFLPEQRAETFRLMRADMGLA